VLAGLPVHNLIKGIIWIIIDQLLIREVDSQVVDSWLFTMHGKFKYVPTALYGRDVASIHIVFDLINCLSTLSCDFKSCAVMAFIYILVNIFDGLDRSADLNIDVTIYTDVSKRQRKNKANTPYLAQR